MIGDTLQQTFHVTLLMSVETTLKDASATHLDTVSVKRVISVANLSVAAYARRDDN